MIDKETECRHEMAVTFGQVLVNVISEAEDATSVSKELTEWLA